MTFSTDVTEGGAVWTLAFRIEFGRRSHKVFVTARRRNSRTQLNMPKDRDRIVQLLEFDMWPEFAQSFFSKGEEETSQNRLF